MRKILSLGFSALVVIITTEFAAGAEAKTYSVCEVLDRGGSLSGKTITVEGFFGGTQFHGYFLSRNPGNDPCPGWRSRYLTSPPALLLGAEVTPDSQAAVIKALLPCIATYRRRDLQRYPVEITGRVRKKVWFPLIFRQADGTYIGWYRTGFGENSAYPVMLVAQSTACGN